MNSRGVTITELVVVVSIIGILAIAMGFQFIGWYSDYKVESATKDTYAELLEARLKAMQRNRPYYVDFNVPAPPAHKGRYCVAEAGNMLIGGTLYVNATGDGDNNGQIDAGHVIQPSFPKLVDYDLTWNRTCNEPGCGIITFDKRGIINSQMEPAPPLMSTTVGTLCITSSRDPALTSPLPDDWEINPDYDCIVLSQTQINMGKLSRDARRDIILNGNTLACNEDTCDTK